MAKGSKKLVTASMPRYSSINKDYVVTFVYETSSCLKPEGETIKIANYRHYPNYASAIASVLTAKFTGRSP